MKRLERFPRVVAVLFAVCLFLNTGVLQASDGTNGVGGKIIVTVDGGSATKKSPISQAIAEKFNLLYVEAGALYRTITYALINENIAPVPENKGRVKKFLRDSKFDMFIEGRTVRFAINDICLSPRELRSEAINAKVAEYSAQFKSLGKFCTNKIRETLTMKGVDDFDGIIADGRTCGSYVFPNADLKFWFYATNDAKLNFRLNIEKEVDDPWQRDNLDSSRKFFPMLEPSDAIVVWTSSRSTEENVRLVWAFIEQKIDLRKHFN